VSDGAVRSPGGGRVLEIAVEVGAIVGAGDAVLVIESMKMEIPVTTPREGRVTTIHVAPGDQVQAGDVLLTIAE
jgi:biotin carboxyl carrier protein